MPRGCAQTVFFGLLDSTLLAANCTENCGEQNAPVRNAQHAVKVAMLDRAQSYLLRRFSVGDEGVVPIGAPLGESK